MTNPINGGNNPTVGKPMNEGVRGRQQAAAPGQTGSAAPADATAAADKAQLSDRLQSIRDAIDRSPDVDMDRVAAIRQSIAEGNYPLDADRIASKFADFEKLLR